MDKHIAGVAEELATLAEVVHYHWVELLYDYRLGESIWLPYGSGGRPIWGGHSSSDYGNKPVHCRSCYWGTLPSPSLISRCSHLQPTILAPLSEIYGRQPIYIPSIFLFAILQIPSVLSPTYAGFAVTRFIVGCFAGLPLSNVGASANDLFNDADLEWAVMSFSFSSQCIGPFIGVSFFRTFRVHETLI